MDFMIKIIEYHSSHHQRFKEINIQWITRAHDLEVEDLKTLDDPENYILKPGGRIFIALYNDLVVGTCGYQNFGTEGFEMIKMAVDETYRGLNIGRMLAEESLKKMKSAGANRIFLFSNTKTSALAVELYKKL